MSNPSLRNKYPTDDDWNELNMIVKLLEPISHATNLLSSSTFGDLHEVQNKSDTLQRVTQKMKTKLEKYWDELKETFYESVILDPNNKLIPFEDEKQSTKIISINKTEADPQHSLRFIATKIRLSKMETDNHNTNVNINEISASTTETSSQPPPHAFKVFLVDITR
ncbi:3754_t:CDS:2, partial [Gigaspora rosea]